VTFSSLPSLTVPTTWIPGGPHRTLMLLERNQLQRINVVLKLTRQQRGQFYSTDGQFYCVNARAFGIFRQEKKRPFTRTSRLHELNAVRFSARGYCKFYGPNFTTFPGLETFGMLALILSREQRIETLQVLLPNKASNSLASEKKDL